MPLNDNLQGMHRVLTLQPQIADPVTGADQIALYNKLDGSSIPELFYRPHNSATPIQMTYPTISTSSLTAQNSFVPGPFVVYGGLLKAITIGQTVTLTPVTTLLYVGLEAANPIRVLLPWLIPTNIVGNQFTIQGGPIAGSMDVYYIAIGQ